MKGSLNFLVILSVLTSYVYCQDYNLYTNETVFTCNDRLAQELIPLTTMCGELVSPCYPMDYTLDVAEGNLIWRVDAQSSVGPVAGYRLTFNDFSTNGVGGILYVGETFRQQPTQLVFPVRNYTFYGSITLDVNEDRANALTLAIGDTFDLEFPVIHASFYSSTTPVRDRGFNVTYCADFDQCASGTFCQNGGTCVRNGFGNYTCNCLSGFEGARCETDIDECTLMTDTCIDPPNATCANTPPGSFTCTCADGFTGDGVTTCSNIDECASDLDNCDDAARATCTDTNPGFTCACNSGFTGNGMTCTNINECLVNNGGCGSTITSTCTDNEGSRVCGCRVGYSSTNPGVIACTNINECTDNTDNCADGTALCTDNVGSFTCECLAGYTGDGVTCNNINECAIGTHNCLSNASCADATPFFTCTCNTGLTGDGITACNNINECMEDTDNCDTNAMCADTVGSFTCTCRSGFVGNGVTCNDIDECLTNNGDCGPVNTSFCLNTNGTRVCSCLPGYFSADPGVIACENVNECATNATNDDNCDMDATCTDTVGSFTCTCNMGFTGNGTTCTNIDECDLNISTCNLAIQASGFARQRCQDRDGGFDCFCNSPNYRSATGIPPCEGFFCAGSTTELVTCNVNGILEWPIPWNGVTNYENNQEVIWLINITATTNGSGAIRFIFREVDVERFQDYIIFSRSARVSEQDQYTAVITGSTPNGLLNRGNASATVGNPVGFNPSVNGSSPFYVVTGEFIYVHFVSDRQNTFSGFLIDYEEDRDDCVGVVCNNSGICEDRDFTFMCTNCSAGFTGMTCSDDVPECSDSTLNNCDANAACSETVGSFACTCDAGFTGNGTVCFPYIVVSNLMAVGEGQDLRISFNITSPFGTDVSYFNFHQLSFTNTVTGVVTTIDTPQVNADNFESFLITNGQLPAFNTYTLNFVFGTQLAVAGRPAALTRLDVTAQNITMPDTTPLAPTNLNRGPVVDNVRYDITWTPPNEENRGMTIAYEVSAIRTEADCSRFRNVGSQEDCATPRVIRFEVEGFSMSYSIVGLLQFRRYNITLRAQTSAGFGPFSSFYGPEFTGIDCPSYNETGPVTTCTDREFAITTPLFPFEYPAFQELFWLFDFRGEDGVLITFEFFELEEDQDFLDFTQGNISAADFIQPGEFPFTGIQTGRTPLQINQNSVNNGFVTARFFADLFNSTIAGFQILVRTNASRCAGSNPCLQNGTCVPEPFDFSCICPSIYGGKICSLQRVNVSVECVATGDSSFRVDWMVTEEFANDPEVINNFTIRYNRAGGPVMSRMSVRGTNSISIENVPGFTEFTATVIVNVVSEAIITLDGTCNGRTNEGTPSVPVNVAATSLTFSSIRVSWDPPTMPVGVIASYTVSYFPTSNASDVSNIAVNTGTAQDIGGLETFTDYSFFVTATNGAQTSAPSATVIQQTSEGVPITAVTNVMFAPTSGTSIVTFTPPAVVTGMFSYMITVTPTTGGTAVTSTATGSPSTIPNLMPATEYNVMIVTSTSAGPGPAFSGTFTTLDGTPGMVANLNAMADSSTSVLVTWEVPAVTNGAITQYRVTWSLDGSEINQTTTTDTMFTISSLEVFTDYLIRVYASTSANEGAANAIMGRSGEGVPTGPVLNLTIAQTATTATLTFFPPTVITGAYNYFAVAAPVGSSFPVVNADNGNSPLEITGLMPFTTYMIEVYAATAVPGRGPGVTMTIMTQEAIPGEVGVITPSNVEMESLTLGWTEPTPATGVITQYRVTWWFNGTLVNMTTVTSPTVTISELMVFTEYTVMVYASTAEGEGTPRIDTITTAEGVPSETVRDPVFVRGMTYFNVTFQPPATVVGTYTYQVIILQNGVQVRNFTTTMTSFSVTDLTEGTAYSVNIAAMTGAGSGPELTENVSTIQVVPEPVSNIASGATSSDNVTLSWMESSSIMGTIYYIITWTSINGGGSFMTTNTNATITNLAPFTSYVFTIVASSDGGNSTGQTTTVVTSEAEPGPVLTLTGSASPGNMVTISYAAPSPVRGTIVGYRVQYMQNLTECAAFGDPDCVNSANTPTTTVDLTYTSPALRPYRTFIFTVIPFTSEGDGPATTVTVRTNIGVPRPVDTASVTVLPDLTAIQIDFSIATPIPGPTNFTVSLIPVVAGVGATLVEELNANSVAINQTVTISNLIEGLGYTVDIELRTAAGTLNNQTVTIVYRTPEVLPNATAEVPATPIPLEGQSDSTAYVSENPCTRANQLFSVNGGNIISIQIIVVQAGGVELTGNDIEYYANVINTNPINAYVTQEVSCTTSSSRKKRTVTANGQGFIIGAESNCQPNTICNGALTPDTTYMMSYRGRNGGGQLSDPTEYGGTFTTAPETGLTAGEIAAIVICSIIVLLLIIALIVFCIKRRRSRKETISGSGGRSNKGFEEKQKYEVDTSYTEQSSRPPGAI